MNFWEQCISPQICGGGLEEAQKNSSQIEQDEIRVSSVFSAMQFERRKQESLFPEQQDKFARKSGDTHLKTSLKRTKRNKLIEKDQANTFLEKHSSPFQFVRQANNPTQKMIKLESKNENNQNTWGVFEENLNFSKIYQPKASQQQRVHQNRENPSISVAQVLVPSNKLHEEPLCRTVERKPNLTVQRIMLPLKNSELTEKSKKLKFVEEKNMLFQNSQRSNSRKKSGLTRVTVLENGKKLTIPILKIRKAESIFDSDSDSERSIIMNRFKTLYVSRLISRSSQQGEEQTK